MFDFILWPISAVLWAWHKVFGFVLGPDNGFAWALSVFFLVFTLRVFLLKPAISQIRSGREMQKFAPHIQKLREKYKNDRQRMAQEMQKLQSEHGVNPLGGCLPMLVQVPVFLSLYWVLRGFTPGAASNQIFNAAEVQSFVDADLFGAKLSNWIAQPAQVLADFGTDKFHMIVVGVPLIVAASVATFFTMRLSLKKQTDTAASNPQSAMLMKAMMYLAPIGLFVSGFFFPLPLAILLYWLANNLWTLGQQHFLTKKIDHEEERKKEAEIEAKKDVSKPKPGQKPNRQQTAQHESGKPETNGEVTESTSTAETTVNGKATGSQQGKAQPQQQRSGQKKTPAKKGSAKSSSKKKRR